jgi:diguanylate cyclase (GGDEF)-like protein
MTVERLDVHRGSSRRAVDARPSRALVDALTREIETLRGRLQAAEAHLAEAEHTADLDQLLPVFNRRAFMRELNREIGLVARYGTPAALLFLDLDSFKLLNDTHGHAAGDAALIHFAELLRRNIREGDIMGRLGGDEFAIILAHADEAAAERKGQSLLALLAANPALWNGADLRFGFCFGSAALKSGETAEDAVARADAAMYARKRADHSVTR